MIFKRIIFSLLLLLLFFPETSLDTSLAINKNSIHSIYLYKLAGLAISDWIIVFLTMLVITSFLQKQLLRVGIMGPIMTVFIIYLCIGLMYNLIVVWDLKSYLYDVKVTLYLLVPYLSLSIFFKKIKICSTMVYKISFLLVMGVLLDAIYINIVGGYEYEKQINMPLILRIIPLELMIGMLFFLKVQKKYLVFGLVYEYLSSWNRANLGSIFWGTLSFYWVFFIKLKMKFRSKVLLMTLSYYSIIIVIPLLIMFVFSDLISIKKDGMEIRRVEVANFIENSQMNFPILIGKGLGATWNEVISPEVANVYSQGHLLESKNNFIWHNTLAGSFYKFGVIGSLFLILYLSFISVKLYKVSRVVKNDAGVFIAYSIPAFVMLNVNGPGELKGALISSLLLFGANQILQQAYKPPSISDK
jgi:hypothetical protein